MRDTEMVKEKSWKEFRSTGLLLIANQILHVFGWAIVCEFNGEEVQRVYPARVKFRGFTDKTVSSAYEKVSKFMVDNSDELYDESKE